MSKSKFSIFRFKKKTSLESASDEPSADAAAAREGTIVAPEQDRERKEPAEVGGTVVAQEPAREDKVPEEADGAVLGARPPEPTALQMAERQDWGAERLKVWQKGDVILNTYQVEDVMAGGMGYVYIAEHKDWNVKMAIKSPNEMMLSDKSLFSRVLREADSWIELGLHPHVAYCYYVRQIEDVPHIFIEYVDGGSLRDWIEDKRCYNLKVGIDVAIQFCHGMGYAHEHAMIHRDVKPENILMTKDGILKVTDFGIVRVQAEEEDLRGADVSDRKREISYSQLTTVGTVMGSADYMSPEQWEDPRKVDVRADIYSFGACLYEMFCGMRPYELTSNEAKKRNKKPYAPTRLREDIPPSLAELLRKSVALDREERHRSLDELRDELLSIYRDLFHEDPPHAEIEAVGLRADGLNNRAVSYAEIGGEEDAIDLWAEALRDDPQHLEAAYNSGVVRWRRGESTDKVLVEQLELGRADKGWVVNYLLGLVHLERGDVDAAMLLLEKVAQQVPEEPGVQSALKLAQSGGIVGCGHVRTCEGHTSEVDSVCLSADNQHALLGSKDWTLRLWDMTTDECLRTFEGHTNEVNSVCLSTDGRYALSGSRDETVRLWDVTSGECLRIFRGHTGSVSSVSLSSDGRYALSGSGLAGLDHTVRLWDVSTGECLRAYWEHTGGVNSVDLSPDGRYVLSGSDDKTVRLWEETDAGPRRHVFQGHTNGVTAVCLSSDSRHALSGSRDRTLRLWDAATGQCLRIFQGHVDTVTSVCLSGDGRYALSGSEDRTLRLWDVSTGQCRCTFEGHADVVSSICLSADGQHVLSGSFDKTLRLWKVALGRTGICPLRLSRTRSHSELAQVETQAEELLKSGEEALEGGRFADALALVQQARELPGHEHSQRSMEVWGKLSHVCRRANFRAAWHAKTLDGHTGTVTSVSLSADGRYALSGSLDKTLRLWDMTSSRSLRTEDWVTSVSLSADGRYALSGSADETLRLWDVASGECLRIFKGHIGPVYSVSLSPDSRHALSGSRDNNLRLWNTETGKCLQTFEGHSGSVYSVCLSADGCYALSGSLDRTLRIWDLATGQSLRVFRGHTGFVYSVSLSTDGRYALSASSDRTLRLWDVATGQCLHTFEGHTNEVRSVSLSSDGRYALSGSFDRTLRLWDVATGECLHVLTGHTDDVTSACLSPDGRYVLSGSSDRVLRLWSVDWELEARDPADWDEGARPYLETFLTLHMPYAISMSDDRDPAEEEDKLAFTRHGKPTWTEENFHELIQQLQYSGYGWLRPEGVQGELERMALEWQPELRTW